jgi:hypothetical protein
MKNSKRKNVKHAKTRKQKMYGGNNIEKLTNIVVDILQKYYKLDGDITKDNIVRKINKKFNIERIAYQKLPNDLLSQSSISKLDNILRNLRPEDWDYNTGGVSTSATFSNFLFTEEDDVFSYIIVDEFSNIIIDAETELYKIYPNLEFTESEAEEAYERVYKERKEWERIETADISTLNEEELKHRRFADNFKALGRVK